MKKQRLKIMLLMLSLIFLAACGDNGEIPTTAPAASVAENNEAASMEENNGVETAVPTPIPPSPTPTPPLAATVNGALILLSDYEKELARYEQAQAELGTSDDNYQEVVLDALIERELIAQAAAQAGVTISDEAVDARLAELREASGNEDNFAAWLAANRWTEAEFRQALAAEMVTEQMVAQVTADVPAAAEQVRARYIQLDDSTLAESLLAQIRSGADFALLASQHSLDQVTGQNGGDLGFFARGSLLVPALEESAFMLQPGETSDVIAEPNSSGEMRYYIVQTVERDPQRPLPADLRYTLLQESFESWLNGLRESAEIVRLVNNGA